MREVVVEGKGCEEGEIPSCDDEEKEDDITNLKRAGEHMKQIRNMKQHPDSLHSELWLVIN